MENLPVTYLLGYTLPPEIEEKYNYWASESYIPALLKYTPVNEVDRYHIIKKDSSYPDYFVFWHYDNLETIYTAFETQLLKDVLKDVNFTFSKIDYFWVTYYQLMRSFRNPKGSTKEREVKITEEAPFVLLETLQLTSEEEHKYAEWCIRYANRIYIPLLMKLFGVKGLERYRNVRITLTEQKKFVVRESNYPSYLQIIYFEDEKAFKNYENSPEAASYKKAILSDISENIVPKWYVQYQL